MVDSLVPIFFLDVPFVTFVSLFVLLFVPVVSFMFLSVPVLLFDIMVAPTTGIVVVVVMDSEDDDEDDAFFLLVLEGLDLFVVALFVVEDFMVAFVLERYIPLIFYFDHVAFPCFLSPSCGSRKKRKFGSVRQNDLYFSFSLFLLGVCIFVTNMKLR
jgi:hypothetical protein